MSTPIYWIISFALLLQVAGLIALCFGRYWTSGPSQILMDRLIGFGPMESIVFWTPRSQTGFVRCERLRMEQMNFFVFGLNSMWNSQDDFTAFNWRDRDEFLFAFGDHASYNCRLLAWDSLYQQVRTYFWDAHRCLEARGGAVGWGTALHTGRSRVRLPMVSLGYFIDIILLTALWPWGRLSPSQKWVPGIFPGGYRWLVRRATTFTAFICHLSCNLGTSTSWNPRCLSRPLQALLYLCFYIVVFSSLYNFVRIISCWEISC